MSAVPTQHLRGPEPRRRGLATLPAVTCTLSERIADQGLVEDKEVKKLMSKIRADARKINRGFPGILGFVNADGESEGYVNDKLLKGRDLTDAYVLAFLKQNRRVL